MLGEADMERNRSGVVLGAGTPSKHSTHQSDIASTTRSSTSTTWMCHTAPRLPFLAGSRASIMIRTSSLGGGRVGGVPAMPDQRVYIPQTHTVHPPSSQASRTAA